MGEHQKYRIIERIDAGGMAEVFRGVAESLQGFKRSVAIKRILPNLCKNKKFISMFLDEARLSLQLQHANIVGVFDIGKSPTEVGGDEAYFIVMEFVDGLHLKGIIESLRRRNMRLPTAHVLYIMMEVCKGLAYAHDVADPETNRSLGIVHRDISPPNILISRNGEVKLVDFGLAKATSQLESTDPGVVKGKFSYLSPEAAQGKEVDRRADVFAVGILLYELLTGKRLFYGENDYQTVELVRQARVPSIAQQNQEVEPDLEAVVRKALAKDVNARYQTAADLGDAIAQFLFSRGMKVTSRDISQLVRDAVAEKQVAAPQKKETRSLIDALIQEEMVKFTSIDEVSEVSAPGATPLSPNQLSGATPLDAGSFVDTRNWTDDIGDTANDAQSPFVGANGASGHAIPSVSRVATPVPRAAPPRAAAAHVDSLEDLLEGDRVKKGAPEVAQKRSGLGVWIALIALVLVGGGAVAYLFKTGVIGHH